MSDHQINDQFHDQASDHNNDPSSDEHSERHHQEPILDQSVTGKKATDKSGPAALGVAWTEGNYSGKKMRFGFLFACLETVLFVAFGIWLMVGGYMKDYVPFCWVLVLLLPIYTWCHYYIVYFYRTWTIRYRLTEHRLYNEEGFFKKTIDTLEIIDIEDMTMEQTFMDRVINGGVGTVIIHSKDKTHTTIKLYGLENPQAAFESIDEMRRRQRQARVIRAID